GPFMPLPFGDLAIRLAQLALDQGPPGRQVRMIRTGPLQIPHRLLSGLVLARLQRRLDGSGLLLPLLLALLESRPQRGDLGMVRPERHRLQQEPLRFLRITVQRRPRRAEASFGVGHVADGEPTVRVGAEPRRRRATGPALRAVELERRATIRTETGVRGG